MNVPLKLLCPQSSQETAVIKLHLVSESGFTETHCLCVVFVWTKRTAFTFCTYSPAVHFDRLMKNKLMWILHILTIQISYLELLYQLFQFFCVCNKWAGNIC